MATFNLELLPDEPILVLTVYADYSTARDLSISNPQVFAMLEAVPAPVAYILDAREATFTITDLIHVATAVVRGQMATFNHPHVREVVIVTANRTLKMAITSVGSHTLKTTTRVRVTSTLEEALELCRPH